MTDSDGHNFDLMTFPEEEWGKIKRWTRDAGLCFALGEKKTHEQQSST
jgi:hypothetical protein